MFFNINLLSIRVYRPCVYYVTSVCKNVLSVDGILLECPVTTELLRKYACNNVRDILYNIFDC